VNIHSAGNSGAEKAGIFATAWQGIKDAGKSLSSFVRTHPVLCTAIAAIAVGAIALATGGIAVAIAVVLVIVLVAVLLCRRGSAAEGKNGNAGNISPPKLVKEMIEPSELTKTDKPAEIGEGAKDTSKTTASPEPDEVDKATKDAADSTASPEPDKQPEVAGADEQRAAGTDESGAKAATLESDKAPDAKAEETAKPAEETGNSGGDKKAESSSAKPTDSDAAGGAVGSTKIGAWGKIKGAWNKLLEFVDTHPVLCAAIAAAVAGAIALATGGIAVAVAVVVLIMLLPLLLRGTASAFVDGVVRNYDGQGRLHYFKEMMHIIGKNFRNEPVSETSQTATVDSLESPDLLPPNSDNSIEDIKDLDGTNA
jgi:membrane protein implicated in regulation of membrane protease activity